MAALYSILQVAVLSALLAALSIAMLVLAPSLLQTIACGRFCANCEYQLPPDGMRQRCPECGADWTHGGAVFSGRRRQHKRLKFAYIASIVCLSVAFMIVSGPGSTQYRLVTTNALISNIIAHRGLVFVHWTELENRALTQEQRVNLAGGLLDRRDKSGILEGGACWWFERQIDDGLLPLEMEARYRTGIVHARLVASPYQGRLGDGVSLAIESECRHTMDRFATEFPAVVFGGFEVDGSTLERADQPVFALGFGTKIRFGTTMRSSPGPSALFLPSESGRVSVRARYWVIGLPRSVRIDQVSIEWNEDGTPQFPDSVLWSIEEVLEETINVPH